MISSQAVGPRKARKLLPDSLWNKEGFWVKAELVLLRDIFAFWEYWFLISWIHADTCVSMHMVCLKGEQKRNINILVLLQNLES